MTTTPERPPDVVRLASLEALFFLSGFAALLYQIVWQRSLFAIYGVNVESVTIVVTAFMLGLGVGSLAGGALSSNPARPALLLFAAAEALIGLFGAFSLSIFRAVGAATLRLAPGPTAIVTFLLVLVPTTLMGATLPLLVSFWVRRSGNVGQSVGRLYYVNTLGAAAACVAAVVLVLGALGQAGTVRLAAAINLAAAAAVYAQHRRVARSEA